MVVVAPSVVPAERAGFLTSP